MTILKIDRICKTYKKSDGAILKNIQFEINKGEILTVLGPSGCGKTSLLRIIAGLEQADSGSILFNGKEVNKIPPHKRGFGMMFQDFALFPHKNVIKNVLFGIQNKNLDAPPTQDKYTQALNLLDLVGLKNFAKRHVGDLSGGERQRVALARSLATNPKVLMLDEPLGALDRSLREDLMLKIKKIIKTFNIIAIIVTHDHSEAFAFGDRVAIINKGEIKQIGVPEELYKKPINRTVAQFLGFKNIFKGVVQNNQIDTPLGQIKTPNGFVFKGQSTVYILIRPESFKILYSSLPQPPNTIRISGIVEERVFLGAHFKLMIKLSTEQKVTCLIPNLVIPPQINKSIELGIHPADIEFLGSD